MSGERPSILAIYHRIKRAAESGRGVRLSADEVWHMWHRDEAIQRVIFTAEEEEG